MRLLNVRTKRLHNFYDHRIPPYAILSHTWGMNHEEVSFAQIQDPETCVGIPGYKKIEYSCQQAASDGLEYTWIDTCCIDKSSSSELTEAINSMFNWYRYSKECYAYLADIDKRKGQDFLTSRWWSRSWTLQELLAPGKFRFFDKHWSHIGMKADLASVIAQKTGIDRETLTSPGHMLYRSIAQRMSWASQREATREEDIAYSLLGIFDINMPLHYGEGRKAFLRLQREIMKTSDDQSLFAFNFEPISLQQMLENLNDDSEDYERLKHPYFGMFADCPERFMFSGGIMSHHRYSTESGTREINGALRMTIPLNKCPVHLKYAPATKHSEYGLVIGVLPCWWYHSPYDMVGVLLQRWTPGSRFLRVSPRRGIQTFLLHSKDLSTIEPSTIWVDHATRMLQGDYADKLQGSTPISVVLEDAHIQALGYQFMGVLPTDWLWNKDTSTLQLRLPHNHQQDHMVVGYYNEEKNQLFCIRLGLCMGELGIPQLTGVKLLSLETTDSSKQYALEKAMDGEWPWHLWDYLESTKVSVTSKALYGQYIYTLIVQDCTGENTYSRFQSEAS